VLSAVSSDACADVITEGTKVDNSSDMNELPKLTGDEIGVGPESLTEAPGDDIDVDSESLTNTAEDPDESTNRAPSTPGQM
jgi:hypothetical protein